MVLAHCMLTAEMLFLAPEFLFSFTVRAERPFVLKTGLTVRYILGQCATSG